LTFPADHRILEASGLAWGEVICEKSSLENGSVVLSTHRDGPRFRVGEKVKMKKTLVLAALVAVATSAANAQYSIVNNIPGTFIDISGSGTALNLSDDGAVNISTALFGDIRVGNNGAVSMSSAANSLGFTNAALPSTAAWFNNPLGGHAVYWDDFYGGATALGNVWWQEMPDRVIVQWTRDHFDFRTDTVTVQLQLFGAGGPGIAQYLYPDVDWQGSTGLSFGASATIGFQYGVGEAVQWSFNTAGAVNNGDVLTVIPAPGALALLGMGGLLAARRRR
jgi:hypothetical protein